ncbi:hypothetical protein D3C76_1580600 [compost metagenome]
MQQVVGFNHDKVGAQIEFFGQQLPQLDFKTAQLFVFVLEVERRHVGFYGNAQFTTVVDVVDQLGLCPWAEQRGK